MDLTKAIELTRQAMIQSIYSKGLTDVDTLKLSQELDKLIVESQRLKREAKKLDPYEVICK
ncbi:aspartyl-phosphate phosphatase Spo0E family protein [Cytobacillus firmus]|uniref:aspartyl-phosphate phosphatase Spo0E family protein n=1 Tax=Cytobacillus firmus TaxID=1399 RepID=UPI001CFCFE82|nr:aspartyl-phosphate phosphatase Spo0E family protein [Cytobacillus firmus]URT68734.1 aspartyl-phosphate phosphatase Spo0E family protein [Cytobacillus firmus]WHY59569.1 aspartyl-phosphate phosphatase Spo0E family protein [Cytobacillus firmus]